VRFHCVRCGLRTSSSSSVSIPWIRSSLMCLSVPRALSARVLHDPRTALALPAMWQCGTTELNCTARLTKFALVALQLYAMRTRLHLIQVAGVVLFIGAALYPIAILPMQTVYERRSGQDEHVGAAACVQHCPTALPHCLRSDQPLGTSGRRIQLFSLGFQRRVRHTDHCCAAFVLR